jgi:hypothetical protein
VAFSPSRSVGSRSQRQPVWTEASRAGADVRARTDSPAAEQRRGTVKHG